MKIKPNLENSSLTRKIFGLDEYLKRKKIDVIEEKPITLYLNSQEIVTMMKGSIRVQSTVSVGTKFTIVLPCSQSRTIDRPLPQRNDMKNLIRDFAHEWDQERLMLALSVLDVPTLQQMLVQTEGRILNLSHFGTTLFKTYYNVVQAEV